MNGRHQPEIPLGLSKKSRKTRVNEEDYKKDRVDRGKAGDEFGGDDIVSSEDEVGHDVCNDTKNTNSRQTVTLGICIR